MKPNHVKTAVDAVAVVEVMAAVADAQIAGRINAKIEYARGLVRLPGIFLFNAWGVLPAVILRLRRL